MVRRRLILLAVCLSLPFAAILAQLGWLQLVPEHVAEHRKAAQHRAATYLSPQRGRILARDGTVLARNQPIYQLQFKYSTLDILDEPLRALVDVLRKNDELSEAPGTRRVEENKTQREEEAKLRRAKEAEIKQRIVELAGLDRILASDEVERDDLEDLPTWLLLASGVDSTTAAALNRRWTWLSKHFETESVLEARLDEPTRTYGIWFQRYRALRMEITLERVVRLFRKEDRGPATPDLQGKVSDALLRINWRVKKEIAKDIADGVSDDQLARKEREVRRQHCASTFPLAADVSISVVTEIEYHAANYPGIECMDGVRREYPLKEAAGTVTGWLKRLVATPDDEKQLFKADLLLDLPLEPHSEEEFQERREGRFRRSDWIGATGLEAQYDGDLRGLHGRAILRRGRKGEATSSVVSEVLSKNGDDVRTTIDARLQQLVYEALKQVVQTNGKGTCGSAAVMEIPSGAMLALVGFPGVDPNLVRDENYVNSLNDSPGSRALSRMLDRPSMLPIFPGSVFKLIVAVAAMESAQPWEGPFDENRRYECTHAYKVIPSLHCESHTGHTPTHDVNLVEALQYSCNCYFYTMGLRHLGVELMQPWAYTLGYGEATGIDLPGYKFDRGRLRPATSDQTAGEKCHYAIGQSLVEATPLQVLRSYAAVAVGGTSVPRPYLVTPSRPSPLQLSNPRTIPTIREGFWRAGHAPGGTAVHSDLHPERKLEHFNAAYKTGTAELGIISGREINNAWLAGFAPFDSPRIAFVAVVERTEEHGADAAGPIVEQILSYFAEQEPEAFLVRKVALK